jgi:hypothetical protein
MLDLAVLAPNDIREDALRKFLRRPKFWKSRFASRIFQDRWVSEVFRKRKGGYFLDFGAFDGVGLSNTLYLERHLG